MLHLYKREPTAVPQRLRGGLAPVDVDTDDIVGMVLQPHPCERAPWRDRPGVGAGLVNRGLHEPATDAAAGEFGRDFRMHENEALAVASVEELGLNAVGSADEAALIGFVNDGYFVSPCQNTSTIVRRAE